MFLFLIVKMYLTYIFYEKFRLYFFISLCLGGMVGSYNRKSII